MLLHDSRRAARAGENGEPILLEEQNRSLGIRSRFAKDWRWLSLRCAMARPARMRCRRRSPRSTPAQPARKKPTGARSSASIDCCSRAALTGRRVESRCSGRDGRRPRRRIASARSPRKHAELREYYLLPAARADLLRRLDRRPEAADLLPPRPCSRHQRLCPQLLLRAAWPRWNQETINKNEPACLISRVFREK